MEGGLVEIYSEFLRECLHLMVQTFNAFYLLFSSIFSYFHSYSKHSYEFKKQGKTTKTIKHNKNQTNNQQNNNNNNNNNNNKTTNITPKKARDPPPPPLHAIPRQREGLCPPVGATLPAEEWLLPNPTSQFAKLARQVRKKRWGRCFLLTFLMFLVGF